MIYEMRSYTLQPGCMTRWLDLYQTKALPIMQKIDGMTLVGYFKAETGALNRVIHIWCYPDAAQRERALAELGANADWIEGFVKPAHSCLAAQKTTLMKPVAFSPLQ